MLAILLVLNLDNNKSLNFTNHYFELLNIYRPDTNINSLIKYRPERSLEYFNENHHYSLINNAIFQVHIWKLNGTKALAMIGK